MVAPENVSADDLREVLARVEGEDAAIRVMAAINYLEDDDATMREIAERYGYTAGWLSRWIDRLGRLESEHFEDVVYDEPRSGRPTELSEKQHEQFVAALDAPPEAAGIDATAWTVPLARRYLADTFGVEYCSRHVRRLMTEAGLSWRPARPEEVDAGPHTRGDSRDGFEGRRTVWTTGTRS